MKGVKVKITTIYRSLLMPAVLLVVASILRVREQLFRILENIALWHLFYIPKQGRDYVAHINAFRSGQSTVVPGYFGFGRE